MLTKENFKSLIKVILSSIFYAMSIKLFVTPIRLLPAGFSGMSQLISLLLKEYIGFSINFMSLYLVLQVITTLIVFKFIGKRFAILSIIQYSLSTVISQVMPMYLISKDTMLLTLYGGILCGISSVLALSAGASTGGTDFIAVYVMNKKNTPIFSYIMYANCIMLAVSGAFIEWDLALYSIIFQFVTTVIINSVHSRQKLVSLTIITDKPDSIVSKLLLISKHGITKIKAEGSYSNSSRTILFMIINEYESNDIINQIRQIDKDVFIGVSKCERVIGKYSINKIT